MIKKNFLITAMILLLGLGCSEDSLIELEVRSVRVVNDSNTDFVNLRVCIVQSDFFFKYDIFPQNDTTAGLTVVGDTIQVTFQTIENNKNCVFDERIILEFEQSILSLKSEDNCSLYLTVSSE